MATASFKMPDDFLLKVSTLGDKTDEIIKRVLEAGGNVVLPKVKSNLQAVIGKDLKKGTKSRSTGEMVSALGITPARVDRYGNYNIKIGLNEPRRKQYAVKVESVIARGRGDRGKFTSISNSNTRARSGKRGYEEITNAMIANVLEHGKHKENPKPFFKPAISASKNSAIEAMKARLDEEINKI